MRTSNPILGENAFNKFTKTAGSESMTVDGTVNKSMFLLGTLIASASVSWYFSASPLVWPIAIGSVIVALILAIITSFKNEWAGYTAPLYAIFEGLFLGAISAIINQMFPGIVMQAIALTFGVFFCLLFAYKSGFIKATENFKLGVVAATGAIGMVYLVSMILRLFNIDIPFIHEGGTIGILFSLFVVVIAALNLVLDFDFIEQGAENQAPKYMEWYAAFGLMVTLVWLYVEILRLLMKLANNR